MRSAGVVNEHARDEYIDEQAKTGIADRGLCSGVSYLGFDISRNKIRY